MTDRNPIRSVCLILGKWQNRGAGAHNEEYDMVSKKRKAGFAIGTGAMIGFLYAGGYYLDRFDSLDFFQLEFYRRWLLYTIIAGIILYVLWEIIARQNGKEKENKKIVCDWLICIVTPKYEENMNCL